MKRTAILRNGVIGVRTRVWLFTSLFSLVCLSSVAQDANKQAGPVPNVHVDARMDARQITVGDQVRLFLEAKNNAGMDLHWPQVPDTFNSLEVVERGKIDTIQQAEGVTYKQRLVLTGFDSGVFKVPAFQFVFASKEGASTYTALSDSFNLLVQTVAIDTTKPFRGIKGIIYVESSWLDYIWYIVGGALLLIAAIVLTIYLVKRKKVAPPAPKGPTESLQDFALRLLRDLDARQLWQKNQVKQYYIDLTDIVRNYIEARFSTAAMEQTTDELLSRAQGHTELRQHYDLLSAILNTADLAKFAKFQPTATEHIEAMERARTFIENSRPAPEPVEPENKEKTN